MKKIIGNKLYDTEKAEKIYSFMQKRKTFKIGNTQFSNGMMLMFTKQKKKIILFMDIATIQPPNRL